MRTAAAIAAATMLVAAAPAPAATSVTVKGRAFTTKAPKGWLQKVTKGKERFVGYALTSLGSVDALSIPGKGQVAVNIYETPVDRLDVDDPKTATVGELARVLLGVPRDATKVKRTTSGTTTLDGEDAITVTYTYTYRSRRIRQQDTVARRKTYAVVVETNADTSSRIAARKARATVQRAWRWR